MDNFRLMLVLALAFVLYLMWQAWEQDYGTNASVPAEGTPPPEQPVTPADLPAPPLVSTPEPTPLPAATATRQEPRVVRVTTDLLDVDIDLKGGEISRADLLAYPKDLDDPATPFRLLQSTPGRLFVAQSGLLSELPSPTHHSLFTADADAYQLADGSDTLDVNLRWQDPSGLAVEKIYTFRRNSYEIDVRHRVHAPADEPWTGRMYGQLQRTGPHPDEQPRFIYTYTGGVLHSVQNRYDKVDFDRMRSQAVARDEPGGWAAMIQHYFAAAWIPPQDATNHYYTQALEGPRYGIGVVSPAFTVGPSETGETALTLYAGPKEQKRLAAAAPGLELTVDFGYLTLLADPIYWLLERIHRLVGNWGWAIVILTILIKVAFYKLSATSYRSMAHMRRVQPKLVALKERYGDDKARLNQAMMDLYKQEKINPLGGCLPILVQIPVFIALYWVLLESVELRQAPFILWIQDLAVYDPYFVLPVLMGISMFVQQKLNPAPLDPIQQKVMMLLPFVFTIFFLFFPAGLVLYWLVNNTLSIAQQWLIMHRMETSATTKPA